jgi:hypothetical protein
MHFNHILQLSIPSTIFQHTARPKVVSSILPGNVDIKDRAHDAFLEFNRNQARSKSKDWKVKGFKSVSKQYKQVPSPICSNT